jgi:DNA-binding MarR family transcriptional regulator
MNKELLEKIKASKVWDQDFKDIHDVFENGISKCEAIPEFSKAISNIVLAGDVLKDNFEEFLRKRDLSLAQKNVLEALNFCHKEYLTQNELSKFVYTSKSNLSSLLERMERKGLIKRYENKENKREKKVKITKLGIEKYSELITNMQNHVSFFDSILIDKEAKTLNNLLNKVKTKVRRLNENES